MMAILRVLRQLDRGQREELRKTLDTPPPDEDILYATDHWLSTLANQDQRSRELIAQLEAMTEKR
jgi:hypothetical protein